MKRVIASTAAVLVTTSVAAMPVQAASADPVTVLKRQLVAGKGVRFTDVTTLAEPTEKGTFLKRTGSLQFTRTGIAASDISARYTATRSGPVFSDLSRFLGSERTITVGGASYHSGDVWRPPKGKSWIKNAFGKSVNGGVSGWYGQRVNAAEPATLKALITSGKRVGRTYSGTIGYGRLERISPWLRAVDPIGGDKDSVIRFRLTLGPDGLPQRLVTSHVVTAHLVETVDGGRKISVETRYTGWGSRVTVKAPPASKVWIRKPYEPTIQGGDRG
ncbi:hypothetical protein ABZ260_49145 [Streptosporangium sp. NPDC006013]|uniref:hypothetical protein n=1 Tax=Streptosporangium sp. NPDC006013 TaxID=3155596 RepID=UPI0033BB8D90